VSERSTPSSKSGEDFDAFDLSQLSGDEAEASAQLEGGDASSLAAVTRAGGVAACSEKVTPKRLPHEWIPASLLKSLMQLYVVAFNEKFEDEDVKAAAETIEDVGSIVYSTCAASPGIVALIEDARAWLGTRVRLVKFKQEADKRKAALDADAGRIEPLVHELNSHVQDWQTWIHFHTESGLAGSCCACLSCA